MASIHLTTFIEAPYERVFDLSRSINLHQVSTASTGEKAIAGVLNGLISLHETVTWQARHLFKTRQFTSRISAMQPPHFFVDEMVKGDFKSFYHEHHFKAAANGTILIDKINFETPYGFIGKTANSLFLTSYIKKFLAKRNAVIKELAESGEWKQILKQI